MELQLALSLPADLDATFNGFSTKNHKRFFGEAFGEKNGSSKKLSFLVRSGMANEEDDDPEKPCKRSFSAVTKGEEEKSKVVGWPPIKAWRKKQLNQDRHQAALMEIDRMAQNENQNYVKVKMEGVAIGRKIDLSFHNSYHTLQSALIAMFAKYCHYDQAWKDEGEGVRLTYEDKEGNWLLAADLPWQNFAASVHCMKITRKKMEHKV